MKERYRCGVPGSFWMALLVLFAVKGIAYSQQPEDGEKIKYNVHAEGYRKAEELGIGFATVSPDSVLVDTYQTLTYTYTAGKAGIEPGGGIRVGVRHMSLVLSPFQNGGPSEDRFFSVTSSDELPVKVTYKLPRSRKQKMFNQYFPFRYIIEAVVESGLKPGQSITIVYGDRSQGSKGYLIQPFDETDYIFRTYVDVKGDQDSILHSS